MSDEKWNGERARDKIAERIVRESERSGRKVTSEEANRKSVEIVQRNERKRGGK